MLHQVNWSVNVSLRSVVDRGERAFLHFNQSQRIIFIDAPTYATLQIYPSFDASSRTSSNSYRNSSSASLISPNARSSVCVARHTALRYSSSVGSGRRPLLAHAHPTAHPPLHRPRAIRPRPRR